MATNSRTPLVVLGAVAAIARADAIAQQTASQLVTVRHASGQGVAPVYEGFDVNADGSFNMWFGYMNRNYEEAVDLPVGAEQRVRAGRRSRPADALHAAAPQGRLQRRRAEGLRRTDAGLDADARTAQTQQGRSAR